jgi:hypothetical protein
MECFLFGSKFAGRRFLCNIISGTTPDSGFPPSLTLKISSNSRHKALPFFKDSTQILDILAIMNCEKRFKTVIFQFGDKGELIREFLQMGFDMLYSFR